MTTRTKSLRACIKAAGDPSADQLARIRTYTLTEVPPEKLYVRTFVVAHNAIDRDRECFDEALLADFARTLPGKGMYIKHPTGWDGDTGPAKGRWFEAELVRMGLDEARALLREPKLQWPPQVQTAVLLMAGAYLVRTNGNADMLEETDAGIVGDISVGFNAKDYERVIDADGRELNVYRWMGPGEALEASLVWLGAQPGARAVKGASRNEEDDVTLEEQLQAAKARIGELETQLADRSKSHDKLGAVQKALGDNANLLDSPDALVETIKAAKAHRDALIDTIVAGERAVGFCDDTEEAVTAAKAIYTGEKLDVLEAKAKRYGANLPKGGKLKGTDPNSEKPGPDTDTKSAPAVFATAPLI